jgi:hypothetical protein
MIDGNATKRRAGMSASDKPGTAGSAPPESLPGRPRLYENAAEKQRAYRERRRVKTAALLQRAGETQKDASMPAATDNKPKTGKELLDVLTRSGLVGMWKDREDIGDSVEFARQLRERLQTRGRD